jgi:hypothetical protein
MPIKHSASLGVPEPKQSPPPASADDDGAAKTKPKPRRRGKAQMIADAVVPDAADVIKLKDRATGETIERPWSEAVAMFRDDKVDFVDPPGSPSPLKYAVMKMDQQVEAGAKENDAESVEALQSRWERVQEMLDETKASDTDKIGELEHEASFVREKIIELGGTDPASDDGYEERARRSDGVLAGVEGTQQNFDPDLAEVGDQVQIGTDQFYVGHGKVLTSSRPHYPEDHPRAGQAIDLEYVWQGGSRVALTMEGKKPTSAVATTSASSSMKVIPTQTTASSVKVEREVVSEDFEQVSQKTWKVTMGYLEKIGLPEYSALHIGPCTASRFVVDDGRRVEVPMPTKSDPDRVVKIPSSVVEGMQEAANVCEYVMRSERQAMISFLEAVKPTQPS